MRIIFVLFMFRYKRLLEWIDATLRLVVDMDFQVNQWVTHDKISELNAKLEKFMCQARGDINQEPVEETDGSASPCK